MGKHLALASSAFLAIGGFLFGFDSGVITSTISYDTFDEYFHHPSDNAIGGIVSSFQGGAVMGTIFNMLFADKLGRKRTIAVGALVSCIGSALQAGAAAMAMMMVGRFIGGFAVGVLTSTIPMYAAELSEPRHRGLQAGLLQALLTVGFTVSHWMGYGFLWTKGSVQWRFPLAFQCFPAALLFFGIWSLVESPRWLMEKGRSREARDVLMKLRIGHADVDATVDAELKEIQDVILADRLAMQTSWKTVFTKPSWRRTFLLGCGVQVFSPLSGANVQAYYGPKVLKILGINTRGALLIGGINSTLTIFYCIIFLLILDRVGRIRPLMVSAAFLAATLFINAVMSSFMDPENHNQLRAFVAMNFLFSLFFIPTGVISWVYPAEIFPVEVRALGNASSTFTNWIINLVVAQFTPHALSKIGMRYLFVFVATNLVALTCYAVFYPETTNISLEAMHKLFGDKVLLEDESGNGERVSDDDGREKERTVHRTEKV